MALQSGENEEQQCSGNQGASVSDEEQQQIRQQKAQHQKNNYIYEAKHEPKSCLKHMCICLC